MIIHGDLSNIFWRFNVRLRSWRLSAHLVIYPHKWGYFFTKNTKKWDCTTSYTEVILQNGI